MLSVALMSAVITCLALLVTLCRVIPMRVILGYATYIDVTCTIALLVFMHGTLGGELIATCAGLLLALFLTGARYTFGYSKIRWIKHIGWTTIDFPSPLMAKLKEKKNAYHHASARC